MVHEKLTEGKLKYHLLTLQSQCKGCYEVSAYESVSFEGYANIVTRVLRKFSYMHMLAQLKVQVLTSSEDKLIKPTNLFNRK